MSSEKHPLSTIATSNSPPAAGAQRTYCSQQARETAAPLYGTAIQVDVWLLVEYSRPWKSKALLDNELPENLVAHLDQLPTQLVKQTGQKLRVQFVKQAATADRVHPVIMIVVAGQVWQRQLDDWRELTDIHVAAVADPAAAGFEVVEGGAILVCTNGQRDVCCARFGLPVYEALRAEFGQRVWQTTHVGGHRYAPNVVYLPGDWFLGFVHADLSVDLVNRLDQGVLDLHHVRGRAGLSPLEQAAEHFARGSLHAVGVDQLQWKDTRWLTEDHLQARFYVGATGTQIELEVKQSLGPAATASCDGPPKPQKVFQLIRLEQVSI